MFDSFSKFSNIEFKVIKIGNCGKNIFGPPIDQWRFYKFCTNDIDLVILNPSILSRAFFREGLFAKQLISKKIPFIAFFHGWDLDFEKRVDKHYTNFFLNSFGHAEKIITLSKEAKKKIIEWGYKGEVIIETTIVDSSLIYDFSFDKKIEEQDLSQRVRILFLARMEKEKGIFELIEAFEHLHKEFKHIELTIAGNGDAFEEVEKRISNIKNIKLVGHIEGDEKANIFKESDIYCLPSYSEGLPVSVLEAMAFGLPVVTTNVGGLKDFFQEEKMGYTAIPKDTEDLIKKIKLLLLNYSKITKIGEFNFNYAKRYLTSNMVSKRLYKHIVNNKENKKMKIMNYEIFTGNLNSLDLTKKQIINTINPHSYITAKEDKKFHEALSASDILIPDGSSMVLAAKQLLNINIDKIAGYDLHSFLLKEMNIRGGRVFYMGASEKTLFKIAKKIDIEYPNITVEYYSPPFKDNFSNEENLIMIEKINSFNPDTLFVGMTAPKQEKWLYQHKDILKFKVATSIGAVFDFYAETIDRPSSFWLNLHLEWFMRFIFEPRRLWKRNLISTPQFLFDMLLYKINYSTQRRLDRRYYA
jgi:N-acetylglucosaminyldiphosphoundecaprenol N-acetyl-beta-D-mannosaminyltransferase